MLVEYFNSLGNYLVKGISDSLATKGLTNTGQTKASLQFKATETRFTLFGAQSLGALDDGASPLRNKTGGFIEAITDWAKSKLSKNDKEARSLAFAYMKKRTGKGGGGATTDKAGNYIVPNPFNVGGVLSDTINKELIAEVKKEVLKNVYVGIRTDIKTAIRALK